jgi:hypothetical protein
MKNNPAVYQTCEEANAKANATLQQKGNNMQDTIYVVVYVEGGNVQGVSASSPNVRVCLVDEDNIEAGDARPDESSADAYDYPVDELSCPKAEKTYEYPIDA